MTDPKINSILREYKYSPFFYWFLFLFISGFFIKYDFIYNIRDSIWIYQIWITILFPLFFINYFINLPVRALTKSRKKVKQTDPRLRSIMAATLVVLFMLDSVLFLVGVISIIGDQHEEAVKNVSQFVLNHNLGMFMEAIIPFVNYFVLRPMRKIIKEQLIQKEHYNKQEELEFAFPFMWISFIISLIAVVIINEIF